MILVFKFTTFLGAINIIQEYINALTFAPHDFKHGTRNSEA